MNLEITLSPEDNHRLANLCGVLDENLKQIESALDVGISRRGSHIRLSGEAHNMRLAAQLLENFYERAKKPISLEEVQLSLVVIDRLKPEEVTTAMPVLMIGGDADRIVPQWCEAELERGLADVRRVELSPCGHYPQYTAPARTAEAIRAFLS